VNSELMVSTSGILHARAENFKGGGNKYSEEFPHYSSEQELKASVMGGCRLCTFLLECLSDDDTSGIPYGWGSQADLLKLRGSPPGRNLTRQVPQFRTKIWTA
jgi:hypothetical protein